MLTEFDVYLFLHMDYLRDAMVSASLPLGVAAGLATILHVIAVAHRRKDIMRITRPIGIAVSALFLTVATIAVFIPTSNTAFLSKSVPKIINAQQNNRQLTDDEKSLAVILDRVAEGYVRRMERGE